MEGKVRIVFNIGRILPYCPDHGAFAAAVELGEDGGKGPLPLHLRADGGIG
jgi:hypothetical protein